jgi:hypothetical protein
MDYTDKTAIKTMPKARRYFNSSAYEDLVEELKEALIDVGMLKPEKKRDEKDTEILSEIV